MVVAIFRSLEGESLEDYSSRLAERWRIGQKGLDNGVILIMVVQERQIRLEVGYGLEPAIPDAVAGQIIREVIVPRFREGRYAAGLEDAVREVYARVSPGAARGRAERDGAWSPLLPMAFVVMVIVFMIVAGMTGARYGRPGRRFYTSGRDGWYVPPISPRWGSGGGWGGGGGFSGGGGSFGGGGASGRW